MSSKILDFRSDTVTRPTAGMRRAMAEANVGDDVLGDDPTVNRLQETVAELLGKEAGLFVPSGTMSNLLAVLGHCAPGDELICEVGCHIFNYEQAGYAQIGGVAARPVQGERGIMQPEQLVDLIRPSDAHYPRTRLLCLENTHNRGGGSIQPYKIVEQECVWARRCGLSTHLDGARLWNAVIATGIPAPRWASHFDSVGVCFSKGLGAPAGSVLTGSREFIAAARRRRKALGGAMRQAGVLAAAALYALEHHVERLSEDHANARRLADGAGGIHGLQLADETCETNLVFIRVDPALGTALEFAARLREQGLLMLATAPQTLRAVTHLDVTAADVDAALAILARAAN